VGEIPMATPHAVAAAEHVVASTTFDIALALALFVVTYAVILTERVNRAIVAVLGAGVMILVGVLTQTAAISAIDFNTLGLLLGMMIVVAVTKESGVFQFVAIWSSQLVKANPKGILVTLSVVTAVFSALLDNVTTVLLITPVILLITKELDVNPFPYLFAAILSSNIGGSATLIGDPPNIMIGSSAGLGFNDFVVNIAPASAVIFVITMVPLVLMWRKSLVADAKQKERIMKLDALAAITDWELLIKALVVLTLVLLGFTVGHSMFHLEPATIALTGAALLLLLDNVHHNSEKQHEKVHHSIAEAEWVTLFFFGGLFVLVAGIEHVGVINWLAERLIEMTGGDMKLTALSILWGSAIISALVDNIPFVATMIPLIHTMDGTFGGADALGPIWWSLALGACLGGNGSLIGASANLVVAGFAEKGGHKISFIKFMVYAFPLMLLSIAISHVYVMWRFL
jgi:Na+/H+ antiporter NhaD/arsenite permease-like protein